ncbi:immunoglobulin superfamily member 2 isoform X1 [Corvus hawaiiensis]|uniref:immunoglobulin superfamily member 2 isoform X1 n=1 Tax=Corvus hawaiiensis TaxID=134902 RepID=UPI00201867E2|nr:immunoglobulin superfamily member 2 isoform X1 [Corvus hawaiiensis]
MGLARCLAAAFLFLFLLGPTTSQRAVTVQKGPLYRVRGSHVTLWCKVSGYQGPAEQNFQWSIYLPSAPEREVQIVSTVDPSFPYAIYTQRVRSRGIFVERLQGDAVLLHITELQERDAGEYECHTPNTDERYFGSYSAKTSLSVIADTLLASMAPQALTLSEGDAVELTCEVSTSTDQHTHLSVGWFLLQGAGDHRAKEVLTLSKDFILKPGPSYEQRFLEGSVGLNKVGNTTYKLFIRGVEPSDQGQLYCEAAEWIEDPDETWKDISRKQTERTSLAVVSQGRDLSVDITAAERSLSEGDTLQLNCVVGAPKSSSRHFKVLWLLNSVEVAMVDHHGVFIWEEEYKERAKLGQLRGFKQSNTVYVLTISEVGLKDKGTYQCSVSEMKTPGDSYSIQTNVSSGIQVNVKPVESHMRLSVSTSTPRITVGDSLILHCEVQGATGPVSVQWWHLLPQHPGHRVLVAAMEQDGTLSLGSAYQDGQTRGSLRLEKDTSRTFTLVIPSTLDEDDGGQYRCEAMQWPRGWNWTEKGEAAVTVSSMGLGLHATLRSRIATIRYGQSFELFCQVNASYTLEKVPASVRWLFQPSPAGPLHELVRVVPSGTVVWGTAQPHFQGKAQLSKADTSFRLHIHSALPADGGTYQCEVEVWRRNTLPLGQPAASTRSNVVGIKVVLPESKLQVATEDSSVEIASSNTAIECRIVFAQNNSQFAVTWYRLPPLADATPLQIIRANYSSILEYGSKFSSPEQKSRFLSQRVSSSVFQLQILSADFRDEGRYYCVVEEWLWLVDGWYKLGEGASGRTTVKFKPPEHGLQMERTNHSLSAREGEEVVLPCRLQGAQVPGTLLSATWFQAKSSGRASALLTLRYDGTMEYPQERLAGRLYLRRPSAGDFSLTLSSVERGDAGAYYCQLQQWQQQSEGKDWALQASACSGYTQLTTIPPESTVLSRICSSPSLLNFILYLPLVLILLLALAVFCCYCKFRKSKKGNITGSQLMELEGDGEVKKT